MRKNGKTVQFDNPQMILKWFSESVRIIFIIIIIIIIVIYCRLGVEPRLAEKNKYKDIHGKCHLCGIIVRAQHGEGVVCASTSHIQYTTAKGKLSGQWLDRN